MLEQILMDINNLFVVPDGRHAGEYRIKGGSIALDFLAPGQYFWIRGSVFNDGLHVYPAADLTDEDFDGVVIAMAVPMALISLSDEIKAWVDKNGQESPYTSESFGGYSYSKATNAQGMTVGWRDVFRARLNPWRKIKGVDM